MGCCRSSSQGPTDLREDVDVFVAVDHAGRPAHQGDETAPLGAEFGQEVLGPDPAQGQPGQEPAQGKKPALGIDEAGDLLGRQDGTIHGQAGVPAHLNWLAAAAPEVDIVLGKGRIDQENRAGDRAQAAKLTDGPGGLRTNAVVVGGDQQEARRSHACSS